MRLFSPGLLATTNTIYYKSGYTSFPATWPSGASSLTGQIYNIYGLVR